MDKAKVCTGGIAYTAEGAMGRGDLPTTSYE